VDYERVTIHEARFVAGQPQRCVSDVLRQAGPADRLERLEDTLHERDGGVGLRRRESEGLAEDRCRDATGTDTVHPYTAFAELHGDRAGEVNDGGLGGAVDVGPEAGAEPSHARRADDRAGALALHDASRVLHPQEDATQQHADCRVEALDTDLVDRPVNAAGAGVVEETVEPAEAAKRLVDHRHHVGLAAHVGMDVHGASAGVGGDGPAALVLDIRQHHRGSLVDEQTHGGFADAAGTSRDDCDLALEPLHTRDAVADRARPYFWQWSRSSGGRTSAAVKSRVAMLSPDALPPPPWQPMAARVGLPRWPNSSTKRSAAPLITRG